jgi:predicted short-subunit dehydrogenase-like oxidoreductase (DUF2520 family)
MQYTITGTGNMAWLLGTKLTAAGHQCMGVYGRNGEAASALGQTIGAPALSSLQQIPDIYDACIIAVADHAISETASGLALQETTLIHTAGALVMDILPAPNKAVLWPVYSILKSSLPQHRNVPVAVEASTGKALSLVKEIAASFSDNCFEADSVQRSWLHLTAVFSNNFINHLMAVAAQICTEQNLPFSAIRPILQQTFERTATQSPRDVQTGPARRGDMETMNKHLALLQSHPAWQAVYAAISASVENMYKKGAND